MWLHGRFVALAGRNAMIDGKAAAYGVRRRRSAIGVPRG
jgi:hypothetical protein